MNFLGQNTKSQTNCTESLRKITTCVAASWHKETAQPVFLLLPRWAPKVRGLGLNHAWMCVLESKGNGPLFASSE